MKNAWFVAAILLAMTTAANATGSVAHGGAHAPAAHTNQPQHARPKSHHAR
jgi:hypothetical protein